ncbi:hypothetical protein CYMTET_19512 [Cymbomonas tetramitiformis]|uniref:HAD family phosphatase n=1 Tax=Cymbomonas tetramitiformis TaxID=36881 RepID=A0AAE0L4T3_9CHLO|nr:hypothetical protein CYMTET_19512 [Cymbomonas tetramitiformis]
MFVERERPLARPANRTCVSTTHGVTPNTVKPQIDLIVTDVDGTLLNSKQELMPSTECAVLEAAARGTPVVVATGKTRGPWAADILPRLGDPMPGLFLQGLVIYDAKGDVWQSKSLEEDVALEAMSFADRHAVSLVAYCGERILCATNDKYTDHLADFGEPLPEPVGHLPSILGA